MEEIQNIINKEEQERGRPKTKPRAMFPERKERAMSPRRKAMSPRKKAMSVEDQKLARGEVTIGDLNESAFPIQDRKDGGGFPDLTGDGEVTKKDILKGRGVPGFSRGGGLAIQGLGFKGVR